MDPNESYKKRKGVAEEVIEKKKQALEKAGESCMKVTDQVTPSESYQQTVELKKKNEDPIDESSSDKPEEGRKLREKLTKGIKPEQIGNVSVYKIPLERTFHNEANTYQKFTFRQEVGIPEVGIPVKINEKVILMVGETGSGKTTLINAMMNYILGVEWEDRFRFKLIDEEVNKSQAHSQTSIVTAYEILHEQVFRIPYPLTIIDTPGFGDTQGIERDRQIMGLLKEFFSSKDGISHLNAVCFVLKGSSARLTQTQKYIFNSIYSIFGKDIANNILFMLTFVNEDSPQALECIREADLPSLKDDKGDAVHYVFDNGSLFFDTSGTRVATMKENWGIGTSSMRSFFDKLGNLPARSLVLTNEVLLERTQLEATLQALVPEIRTSLSQLDSMTRTRKELEKNLGKMNECNNFTYEVPVTHKKKEPLDSRSAMNCPKCQLTCHYPCGVWGNAVTYMCEVFTWGGECTICKAANDSDCTSGNHTLESYKWVTERSVEVKEYKDLKKKYETAYGKVMTLENIMEKMNNEHTEVNQTILRYIKTVSTSLTRLHEIALKPNAVTTPEYIEKMIRSEEMEAEPGYKKRVMILKKLKQQAEILKKIENNEPLLPAEENIHQNINQRIAKLPAKTKQAYVYLKNSIRSLWRNTKETKIKECPGHMENPGRSESTD